LADTKILKRFLECLAGVGVVEWGLGFHDGLSDNPRCSRLRDLALPNGM
jgi:hypothetical protein